MRSDSALQGSGYMDMVMSHSDAANALEPEA